MNSGKSSVRGRGNTIDLCPTFDEEKRHTLTPRFIAGYESTEIPLQNRFNGFSESVLSQPNEKPFKRFLRKFSILHPAMNRGANEFRYSPAILGLLLFSIAVPSFAENWPAWRGPNGNGISNEKNPPMKWSATENVTWKASPKGTGSSTPAVWNDRIFITAQTPDEVEWVLGLDRNTGKTLWEHEVGKGMRRTRGGANMASASCSTDGEVVVGSVGTGALFCFDLEGKPLWNHDLEEEHGKINVWWGYSNSPLLYKDFVFVTVIDEGPSYLLAIDKKTGKTRWKADRKTPAKSEATNAYVTPLVYDAAGRTEVFLTGGQWATAYDLKNGDPLWKAEVGGDRTIVGPTYEGGMIYVTAGKRGPLFAIKPGGKGDVTETNIEWKYMRATPDVPCPLAYGDYVYFANDSGMALCLSKSKGELMYQERLGGDFKASPIAADGKLFFLNRDGQTMIVEAGKEFKLLATTDLGEGVSNASLALSDGQFFIRANEHLFCIGERRK